MRELDILRRTHRRFVHREIGRQSGPEVSQIHFNAELEYLQADTALAHHPEDVAGTSVVQGPGGGWTFMVDGPSLIDGPEPIG